MIRHRVASLCDIPEDTGLPAAVGALRVALFRRGRTVHALADACPHMGAALSDGYLDERCIVCPWHGWTFDLATGRSEFDEEIAVPVYRVVVEGEDVILEVDEATLLAAQGEEADRA